MAEWIAMAFSYPGWSLEEIKGLSNRERNNWLEVARQYGKVSRKQ